MERGTRKKFKHNPIRRLTVGAAAAVAALGLSAPVASATEGESGAVTGAGFGPTLGVGGPSSYTGGGTANHPGGSATIGVGGPSSYTGGATANHPGGTATQGVGGVNSYTGQGTSGTADNGTNATTRTGNYGPGH